MCLLLEGYGEDVPVPFSREDHSISSESLTGVNAFHCANNGVFSNVHKDNVRSSLSFYFLPV